MSDPKFTIHELDAALKAAVRITTICNAVLAGENGVDRVTMRAHHYDLVCDAMDAVAKNLRIVRTPIVVDKNDRPAAVDLAIPSELAHVFSFIAGRSDGTLFVMSPRVNAVAMLVTAEGTTPDVVYTPPTIVPAHALVRIDFQVPR